MLVTILVSSIEDESTLRNIIGIETESQWLHVGWYTQIDPCHGVLSYMSHARCSKTSDKVGI